jgi:hypothetical protein
VSDRVGDMTKEELREFMSQCVHDTLTSMGVDTSEPLNMQRDFQYLRDWRIAVEATKRKGILTLITVLITGMLGLLWLGFKENFFNSGP